MPSADDTTDTVLTPTMSAIEPHDDADVPHATPPIVTVVPAANVGVSDTAVVRHETDSTYAIDDDANVDGDTADVNDTPPTIDDGLMTVPPTATAVRSDDARVNTNVYTPSLDDVKTNVLVPTVIVAAVITVVVVIVVVAMIVPLEPA